MSCFERSFFFFSCPRGRGDFFWKKSCGHRHFVEIFFQKNDLKKKMVFYLRKTNAIIWYFHLLCQKSKKNSILKKVVFSLNVTFFKNYPQISRWKLIWFFWLYPITCTSTWKKKSRSWSTSYSKAQCGFTYWLLLSVMFSFIRKSRYWQYTYNQNLLGNKFCPKVVLKKVWLLY